MLKPNKLARAVAFALLLPGITYAEIEVSGEAKIEYSLFTQDGQVTGAPEAHDAGDAMKSEASVKLFLNADVGEESAIHAELLLADDGEAASSRLEGGEDYTQYEVLRELYIDTSAAGWDFRLGKQQIVWGTADGMKLLDIINPTDFRELNQNVTEDARIPVWAINAEKEFDSGASIQFIASEAQPNFIAGLDADGDAGAPFIFKGVDTITGKTNGFLNIASDFGKTSGVFQTLLGMGGLTSLSGGPMALTTVAQFTSFGTGAPYPDFNTLGGALLTPPTIDLDGDGFPEAITTDADVTGDGVGDGVIMFASPSTLPNPLDPDFPNDTGSVNNALVQAIFLPFMNGLQNGNNVLNAAANGAGDLLNNFGAYATQLQYGLMTGTADGAAFINPDFSDPNTPPPFNFDANGDGTADSYAVLDINGDGLADTNTVGAAMQALGTQMGASVMAALAGQGVDVNDPAQVAGALTQATGITVAEADVTGQTMVFQGAVQTAAMAGLASTFFSNSTTNQFTGTLNTENPTSAFDYMGNTAFATFESFIGMNTEYRKGYETDPFSQSNLAFRYKNSTDGGTNYSLNYAYHYDNNPYIEMSWEDMNGNKLGVYERDVAIDALGQPLDFDQDGTVDNPNPKAGDVTMVLLTNPDGSVFDSSGGNPATPGANPATLVMEEKLNRISTLGASFDTAIDGAAVPVIIRGEFSYDVGTKQPVIDRNKLAIGNLTAALRMEDADMFRYVLGVDVTVLTNMLVSTQLIQMYNLDFVDEDGRYTGDFSSMHLTNGLKKGDEVETFISFFLSKPFGDDGQHRWNNILIAENDGGYWNRFDVEYSFNDEMVGTVEYNKYWGDENTTFGQFENSSNLQLGFKYIF